MRKRRMATFAVAPRLIENSMQIPKDHKIVGAEWDFVSNTIRFYVEGPALPEVEEGCIAPSIMPSIVVNTESNGMKTFTWDWAISS